MDQLCVGMAAFLERQTPKPESVSIQQENTPKKKYKLSQFGDDVQKVLELVGMKDKGLLATYEQILVQNGFETPDLMMACTLHDFVGMKFRNGHALKLCKILSQIEDDVDL